jgi:hypothetical protein
MCFDKMDSTTDSLLGNQKSIGCKIHPIQQSIALWESLEEARDLQSQQEQEQPWSLAPWTW